MRIRTTRVLRWIEEADARQVWETAFAQQRVERLGTPNMLGRRLSAFGAGLRATLFTRPPKRRDCRC